MPLYEYACEECAHEFETLVFNGEEAECPHCRSKRLRRNLSLPGRPQTAGALPMGGCDSSVPPCGPACRRWPGNS